jgi:cation diffusion facilitator CzcD-associated flavoprotein CzcO
MTEITSAQQSPVATETASAVIIGAGPAGIAAAVALERAGVPAVVLERGAVGAAWRTRYDRLRLNSSRLTSRLPGAPYPPGTGLFAARDDFVAYLERAAEAIEVRTGTPADRIDRDGAAWTVRTPAGELRTPQVIVATGFAGEPWMPAWPGRERFQRQILHSSEYRHPVPFAGRDVLVAGAGSSAMEIAYDLVEGGARRVRLAVRTPPNLARRSLGGAPGDPVALALARLPTSVADGLDRVMRRLVFGDLRPFGLPRPEEGPFARLKRLGVAPAIVDREVIGAIRDGRITVVRGVAGFDATGVRLDDGARLEPDAVIAATGYRCGLEPLVGHLGVLDERGRPRATGAAEAAPGLRFVGFVPVPGQIRHMGVEARRAARAITHSPRATGPA